MKKSVIGFLVISILILSLSMSFVSASWFSDIWAKITGQTITGNAVTCQESDSCTTPYGTCGQKCPGGNCITKKQCCAPERVCIEPDDETADCVLPGECCIYEHPCFDTKNNKIGCAPEGKCCSTEKTCNDGSCVKLGSGYCCPEDKPCFDGTCIAKDACCSDERPCQKGMSGANCVKKKGECCTAEGEKYCDNGGCAAAGGCCSDEKKCTDTGQCIAFDECCSYETPRGDGTCCAAGSCCGDSSKCSYGGKPYCSGNTIVHEACGGTTCDVIEDKTCSAGTQCKGIPGDCVEKSKNYPTPSKPTNSIWLVRDSTKNSTVSGIAIEFLPHGLVFNKNATKDFKMNGVSIPANSSYDLYYYPNASLLSRCNYTVLSVKSQLIFPTQNNIIETEDVKYTIPAGAVSTFQNITIRKLNLVCPYEGSSATIIPKTPMDLKAKSASNLSLPSNPRRPTITWTPVANFTTYNLLVYKNGKKYLTNLTRGTSWTSGADLAGGDYTYWVQPLIAKKKYGAWSAKATFKVPVALPVKIKLIKTPLVINNSKPTLSWQKVGDVSRYHIQINRNGVKYLTAATLTPSYTLTKALPTGKYQWWVRAWNLDGYGSWSDAMNFTKI